MTCFLGSELKRRDILNKLVHTVFTKTSDPRWTGVLSLQMHNVQLIKLFVIPSFPTSHNKINKLFFAIFLHAKTIKVSYNQLQSKFRAESLCFFRHWGKGFWTVLFFRWIYFHYFVCLKQRCLYLWSLRYHTNTIHSIVGMKIYMHD